MSSFERPPSVKPVLTQKILQQSREAESALADALVRPLFLQTQMGKFPEIFSQRKFYFQTFEDGQGEARALNSRKPSKFFEDHSDDSETSSVCSERSFDSLRRPSDVSSLSVACTSGFMFRGKKKVFYVSELDESHVLNVNVSSLGVLFTYVISAKGVCVS